MAIDAHDNDHGEKAKKDDEPSSCVIVNLNYLRVCT